MTIKKSRFTTKRSRIVIFFFVRNGPNRHRYIRAYYPYPCFVCLNIKGGKSNSGEIISLRPRRPMVAARCPIFFCASCIVPYIPVSLRFVRLRCGYHSTNHSLSPAHIIYTYIRGSVSTYIYRTSRGRNEATISHEDDGSTFLLFRTQHSQPLRQIQMRILRCLTPRGNR